MEKMAITEINEEEPLGTKDNHGVYYKENRLTKCEDEDIVEYRVQEGCSVICDEAFNSCFSLNSITLPEGLTHIGSFSFASCENLETIELPSTLEYLGDGAFVGSGIKNLIIHSPFFTFKNGCLIDNRKKVFFNYFLPKRK